MTDDLTCKEVSRTLSDGLDAEMEPAERTRLRFHLVSCDDCRNVEHQLKLLRRLMLGLRPDGPDDEAR
jgi:predicted anti-sigma-YlaC factor YlaD